MKATGEVMSISDSFESALMKALRGAEISVDTVRLPKLKDMSDEEIRAGIGRTTDERLFYVAEGLYRGISIDEIHQITMIDNWFLCKINNLIKYEKAIAENLDADLYIKGKKLGFTDKALERISGKSVAEFNSLASVTYKMVDTCAGEFEAVTPYFYATYNTAEAGGENEASIEDTTGAKTVIVIGSGPIRIGQGIEFDYAAVHCVHALRELGYRVVIINNNPETVSTDFDTGDRLYFEPLTPEDVLNIIDQEKPVGVVVAFGGQTAIKLTKTLAQNNINIIGTSADSIDMAEDRERFDALLERLGVKRPKGYSVLTKEEAFEAAHALEYPILLRPSYVLGGQNMTIAFHDDDVEEYMNIILGQGIENPVLIDKYIQGKEIEVDAIYDGHDVLIPGIMEHIERAGIHSGDSIAIYPAKHIYDRMAKKLVDTTRALCEGLASIGIVNIQYIVKDDEIYVIEVNPRASRTVPYMSKVTGVLMVDCAIRVSLGEKLADMDYGVGFYRQSPYTCVKVPVFSFEKLTDVDTQLGPEMKSTGEVLGVGRNLSEALFKGLVAAGYKMYKHGGVLITVRDSDKSEIVEVAKKFDSLGFNLYATPGNAAALEAAGMKVEVVHKIHESDTNNTMTLLESGKVNYIISTSAKGRLPARDSVKLRRRAVMLGIPCLTAIDTADALADSLMSRYSEINTELVDINNTREKRKVINFTKMQGCGNDYIYIDCLEKMVSSPESLSVYMSDRHFGVGGDGIVLIAPSRVADCRMIMFNLDGSEGNMCGNAIRCVGKYMYDVAGHKKKHMTVETKSGIKKLELMTLGDEVVRVKVDMGKAELTPSKIPVTLEGDAIINRPVDYNGTTYNVTCVSMGNPHAVIFTDLVDALDLEKIGPDFETHEIFPERVNTEFIKVIDEHTLKMRVWERGSGETLACGTGACAAAVAACLNGYCKKGEDIKVILRGGELIIRYTDEAVYMTGNCEKVFTGSIEI